MKTKKVLHISTTDVHGGAAIAAYRLHTAMLQLGIDSTFFCLKRTINDDDHIKTINRFNRIKAFTLDTIHLMFFTKFSISKSKMGLFSNMLIGLSIRNSVDISSYDIIYLHWINASFISLKTLEYILSFNKKVYWFMHDMFPITGGCHHSYECDEYKRLCGFCPYLQKQGKKDFSNKQLKYKHKILSRYNNLCFVAPSNWLYQCAKESYLGQTNQVYYIPNLLDKKYFKPLDQTFCRETLNIPVDKKVILFGADSALRNPYKGFDFFLEALKMLNEDAQVNSSTISVVLFGSSVNENIRSMLPFDSIFMGYVHDVYTLNLLYNAADVFCIPSLAEAFGQTALESIFAQTSVVGFNIGGLPDIINNCVGYLADYKNSYDLYQGLKDVLFSGKSYSFDSIDKFTIEKVIEYHIKMWE